MINFLIKIIYLLYSIFTAILMTPFFLYMMFKADVDAKLKSEAIKNSAQFFRLLKSPSGESAIPGIEELSDTMIQLLYRKVMEGLKSVAEDRRESLAKATVNGLVRDRLIDQINEKFDENYDWMINSYRAHGIGSVFIKGRPYQ